MEPKGGAVTGRPTAGREDQTKEQQSGSSSHPRFQHADRGPSTTTTRIQTATTIGATVAAVPKEAMETERVEVLRVVTIQGGVACSETDSYKCR